MTKFQLHDPSNVVQMMKYISLALTVFFQVFLICESSQRITDSFDKMDVYTLWNWYSLPSRTQKYLPMIVANFQQEVVLSTVGSLTCSRDTFKRVNFTRRLKYTTNFTLKYIVYCVCTCFRCILVHFRTFPFFAAFCNDQNTKSLPLEDV